MAEYIASLDMSLFVLDYDYNAPTPDHLNATHEQVYKIVREKHPDIPIVMISAPKFTMNADLIARKNIIKQTYDSAKAAGDRNVYIIYGDTFFEEIGDDFSVDNVHPTDLGFDYMVKAICPVIKNTLEDK
jgi:lysophospholipase L1-like esterase